MSFLCQLRLNGNVKKSIQATTIKEALGALHDQTQSLLKTNSDDLNMLQNINLSVQAVPDGPKPDQYQGLVLFTLVDGQAEQEGRPTLESLKEYIEQACEIRLDDEEQGNPYGLAKPLLLVDSLMPLNFDLPQVDPMQICYYFRRRGFQPYKMCTHNGVEREVMSFPYPTENNISIMLREKDNPLSIYEADVAEVKIKK